jgi:hypothetical protein
LEPVIAATMVCLRRGKGSPKVTLMRAKNYQYRATGRMFGIAYAARSESFGLWFADYSQHDCEQLDFQSLGFEKDSMHIARKIADNLFGQCSASVYPTRKLQNLLDPHMIHIDKSGKTQNLIDLDVWHFHRKAPERPPNAF